jgi:Putative prokaryotic signal transducing protein
MDKGWQLIYYSDKQHLVQIVKAVLTDNGIEYFELNKKDSSYVTVGEIELYVKAEEVSLARIIIEQNNL